MLEEVVSLPNICNVHSRLWFLTKKEQEKTDRAHLVIFGVALTEPSCMRSAGTWMRICKVMAGFRNAVELKVISITVHG